MPLADRSASWTRRGSALHLLRALPRLVQEALHVTGPADDLRRRLRRARTGQSSKERRLIVPYSFSDFDHKTAKFFNPLNVFPMSPVNVTTPFLVRKALKTANSGPPNSLVFRRKPAPGVCSAPKSVFCLEKPANSSPPSLSPPKSPARRGTAQSQPASDAAARRGAP